MQSETEKEKNKRKKEDLIKSVLHGDREKKNRSNRGKEVVISAPKMLNFDSCI